MKRIYSHHNSMLVGLVQSKLEQEGITLELKNDIAVGGAGELAPIDLWPELWVVNDDDLERALHIIESFNKDPGQTWQCQHCGEENEASFEICWQCNN